MKKHQNIQFAVVKYFILTCIILMSAMSFAQQNIIVNLAMIDGVNLTPDNIFNYTVQPIGGGTNTITVLVKGSLHYRNSPSSFSYSFRYTIHQGGNSLSADQVHPQWQFSSSALQELFFTYKTLPEGTYEYCVTVTPVSSTGEVGITGFDECLYHRSDDVFLINLIDPENKAKLHEYNPMLSWVANYSFSSQLTYRLRVAEIKQGQNATNAVMRNQPVFSESNLMQNSLVYPVYAKPLVKDQPYAWAIDAYYKGILLGGSEAWEFIILDDSVVSGLPANRSYIDIKREDGKEKLYAVGQLKIKYVLEKLKNDELELTITDNSNKQYSIKPSKLAATYGDNRYTLNLKDDASLKHLHQYNLIITSKTGEKYQLPFEYVNPDFVK
jgi:hypothetical protein